MAKLTIERAWTLDEDEDFLTSAYLFLDHLSHIMDQLNIDKSNLCHRPTFICSMLGTGVIGYEVYVELTDEIDFIAILFML